MLRASSLGLKNPRNTTRTLFLPCKPRSRVHFFRASTRSVSTSAPCCAPADRDAPRDLACKENTFKPQKDWVSCPQDLFVTDDMFVDDYRTQSLPPLPTPAPTGRQRKPVQPLLIRINSTPGVDDAPADPLIAAVGPIEAISPYHGLPHMGTQGQEVHSSRVAAMDYDGEYVVDDSVPYAALLRTIAATDSPSIAWEAYRAFASLPPHDRICDGRVQDIPIGHLHRIARLIAASRPRTRTLFLRFLSILSHLRRAGGSVKLWQWNALIDFAGKGWRKTRPEDFDQAFDVFRDLISHNAPGTSLSGGPSRQQSSPLAEGEAPAPDIITFTSLLNIASRSLNPRVVHYAVSLLEDSKLPPNRITHLSLLRYYTRTKNMSGVRNTILKLREQNIELGLDGLNACLWSFARNGAMDVACIIYRVLRHNSNPETEVGGRDVDEARSYLERTESILIPTGLLPNHITYNIMIQCFAYQGDLLRSSQVFMDMLTSPNPDARSLEAQETDRDVSLDDELGYEEIPTFAPTHAAFRAIFLGFYRHSSSASVTNAHPVKSTSRSASFPPTSSLNESAWDLTNLLGFFKSFMALPEDERVSERTIYWIIKAFTKASNNDQELLRDVWNQLVFKFGGAWGGRLAVIDKSLSLDGIRQRATSK